MKEVREQLLARKREAARRPPPDGAMTGNPLSQSMDFERAGPTRSPVDEAPGVSVQDQSEWQKRKAAKTR